VRTETCRRIQAATTAAKNPFEIERQQLGVGTADRQQLGAGLSPADRQRVGAGTVRKKES